MLYGSIRRNLYAHLSIHKMRWTLVFDYLFTPISTPKWHESIWFCMKFYEFTISKNLVTMRFYGLLLRYIDLWKKANLQRFLISYSKNLLYYRYFMLSDFGAAPSFLTVRVRFSQWMAAPIKPISHPCAARFPTAEHIAGGCRVLLLGFGQRLAVFSRRSPSLV